jgi:hypothetical protein
VSALSNLRVDLKQHSSLSLKFHVLLALFLCVSVFYSGLIWPIKLFVLIIGCLTLYYAYTQKAWTGPWDSLIFQNNRWFLSTDAKPSLQTLSKERMVEISNFNLRHANRYFRLFQYQFDDKNQFLLFFSDQMPSSDYHSLIFILQCMD